MKQIYLLVLLVLPLILHAQQKLYFTNNSNSRIEFIVDSDLVYVQPDTTVDKKDLTSFQKTSGYSVQFEGHNFQIINTKNSALSSSNQKLSLFRSNKIFKRIEPVLVYSDSTKEICDGSVIVKLSDTTKTISELFKNYKIDYNLIPGFEKHHIYDLVFDDLNTQQIFKIIDSLSLNPAIAYIEPNFLRLIKPATNDLYFNSQWAINNNGGFTGTAGADMKVDEAWNYLNYDNMSISTPIKIAVMDEGVQLDHPDLIGNLLPGRNSTDGTIPYGGANISQNDGHGTACAGIIAATGNNGIGIAGVAYRSKIIPVRIAYSNGQPLGSPNRTWVTKDEWIALAFAWTWQSGGADIISCSWSGGSGSSFVQANVNAAMQNGRSGKGCTVVVAVGNNNSNGLQFPSTINGVIATGASSPCDKRKSPTSCDGENWGSNYGDGINLIAPGVQIYTTDLTGTHGYSFNDYYSSFNGTSAATPNVAGVAALVLSKNKNLTSSQVKQVLTTTCDKVGGYSYVNNPTVHPYGTYSIYAGYGRVNAYKAVQMASLITPSLTENKDLNQYKIYPNPATNSINVKAISLNIEESATNVKIYHQNGQLMQNRFFKNTFNEARINVQDLPMGIYYIEISTNKHSERQVFKKVN